MNPAERNYGIPDKEALMIVKGLQNWRHWLERTRLPVQILTDHKNLEYFAKPRILNQQQMHWLELLTHYNYEIHYRPGDKNCTTDALSRCAELRPAEGKDKIPQSLIPAENFTELAACEAEMTPSDWEGLGEVFVAALAVSDSDILAETHRIAADWEDKLEGLVWDDGLGRKEGRIWIPESDDLWKKVMGLYHDSPVTGHLGTLGTLELVGCSYWRCDLAAWVKRYVQGCHTCRRVKHRNQWEFGKLQPIPAPDGPWQWIQLDFIGELPKSSGFNAIYVVSDQLTKMAHFIPTTTDISAPDLMKLHIQHIWKLHGIPLVHGTDQGSTFTAAFTKSLYKGLGIEPRFSTAYHPRHKDKSKTITSGWKPISACSVLTVRMIGPTSSRWRNLRITIITIRQLIQLCSSQTLVTTRLSQMSQQRPNPMSLTCGFGRSTKPKRNVNAPSNSHRKSRNRLMTNGNAIIPVSKSEIRFGSKLPTLQPMSHPQNL